MQLNILHIFYDQPAYHILLNDQKYWQAKDFIF